MMLKISKSPDRHSFQKDQYLKADTKKDLASDDDVTSMWDVIRNQEDRKFDDPKSRIDNMEYDLLTTDWILEKVRSSDSYAQNLYSAMCNNDFQKLDVIPILKNQHWSCSWRSAGGIIANMRQEGDYIDWYCSGIGGGFNATGESTDYVSEGTVTNEIEKDLKQLGWALVPGGDWENKKR